MQKEVFNYSYVDRDYNEKYICKGRYMCQKKLHKILKGKVWDGGHLLAQGSLCDQILGRQTRIRAVSSQNTQTS